MKNYSNIEDDKILQIVGSIEKNVTHPIGKAFTDYLENENKEFLNIDNFENLVGLGVKASIENDEYLIGNAKLLSNYKIENNYNKDEKIISEEGNSIVYVVKNNRIIAIVRSK